MLQLVKHIIVLILFFMTSFCYANTNPKNEIDLLLNQLIIETNTIKRNDNTYNTILHKGLSQLKKQLHSTKTVNKQVSLLIKKEKLQEKIKASALSEASDISKIRYLKGLQIIKILYEKTLSLDHHFTSVATFNEINNLSNPNNYPEFTKMKDDISNK